MLLTIDLIKRQCGYATSLTSVYEFFFVCLFDSKSKFYMLEHRIIVLVPQPMNWYIQKKNLLGLKNNNIYMICKQKLPHEFDRHICIIKKNKLMKIEI